MKVKTQPMLGGQTRSWTQKTMPDSENMGQNRGGGGNIEGGLVK